jgi:predicted DsbA family dithiol-disulfide isomerase
MSDSATPDRVTVYSDYVCPFCYLGRHSLQQYRESHDAPIEIEWHPFDLRADRRDDAGAIDPTAADGKDDAYYERARENVERLSDEYGVDMAQTLVRDVDSWNAQLASVAVQMDHPEAWPAFDWAIFDALWQDGRDIGDPAVLADLAESVGLDAAVVEAALDDEMVARRLTDQFEAARIRGISGVPTFVVDGQAVQGAVPPEQFEAVLGE